MEYQPNSSLRMETPNIVSGIPSIACLLICLYFSGTWCVPKLLTLFSSRHSGN